MKLRDGSTLEVKQHVKLMVNEAYGETLDETDGKWNEKDDLGPVISTENRIVTGSKVWAAGKFQREIVGHRWRFNMMWYENDMKREGVRGWFHREIVWAYKGEVGI
jgi:hypothetical protein